MPVNKLALIRYKTIDQCLRNRQRKWTLDDLIQACSDALYEYEGIMQGISRRSIQLDIQNMRSEKLGYNAPIIVTEKKYYSYEDKNYSITNSRLSRQDLDKLTEVVGVLKQFKGFNYFSELTEMVSRLENKIYTEQHQGISYIDFEKNELLKGLEYIEPLHKSIIRRSTLLVRYQSFKAREPGDIIFYPYLLKEYRNRWFLMGMNRRGKTISLLALDRIQSYSELPGEPFVMTDEVDVQTFFDDALGVTKSVGMKPHTIALWVNPENAPYIKTKPLHPSQAIHKEDADGMYLTIKVVWNFELEREILGFGECMKVLSPRHLKNRIYKRLQRAAEHYKPEKQAEQ